MEWIHGAELTNVYQILCYPTNELGDEYIKARDEIGGGRDTKVHFDPENENSSE